MRETEREKTVGTIIRNLLDTRGINFMVHLFGSYWCEDFFLTAIATWA